MGILRKGDETESTTERTSAPEVVSDSGQQAPAEAKLERMAITPKQIREIELPTSVRGFDKAATRELLESAARALNDVIAERDDLRRRLDEKLSEAPAFHDLPHAPAQPTPEELSAIGAALLTAQQTAERVIGEAREEAARLQTEAEQKRSEILRAAQADAANQVSGVKQRLEAMTAQEAQLREMLASRRLELGEFIHRAVDRLAQSREGSGSETLEGVLHERVEEQQGSESPA
jgi:cell division septum initiation protein DivIVA